MNKPFKDIIEEATEKLAKTEGDKIYPRIHPAWEGTERAAYDSGFEEGSTLPNELLIMALEALDYIAHSPTRDCKEPFAAEVLKKIISKLEGASK